jgi:hypothetical protein
MRVSEIRRFLLGCVVELAADAGGDDAAQSIGAGVSSHPKAGAHKCRPGGEPGDPACASGRCAAVQTKVPDGVSAELWHQRIHYRNGLLPNITVDGITVIQLYPSRSQTAPF